MEKKKEQKERKEEGGEPGEGQPVRKRKRRKGRSEDKGGAARDPQKPKPRRTPFDTIIKAGLEPYYPDLIHWLLGERPSKVSPLDPNLPVIRHRDADKILKISFKDRPPLLAHIEFQMKSDPSMPERMAEYLILIHRLRERLKYKKTRYFCAVIYFDRKNFHRDPGRLVLEGESTTRLECAYDVIKLWEMDPTAALEMKSPGLWPFIPLMAGKVDKLAVKSKEKIRAAPATLISPEQKGELLFVMAALIARVVEDPKMREQLLELLSQDTENPFVKFLREQGRKEGKAEGKAEGAVEEARRSLLHALERRFGCPSQDLVRRIGDISCLEKLRALHDKALVAPRIQVFLKSLK